jgi:hypothetical protein
LSAYSSFTFCAEVEPVTELLAVQRLRSGDRAVVGAHQQVLVGDEVRAGEVDLGLALVGDRVGGDDEVDVTVLDQRLAVGGLGLRELDVVRVDPELLGDVGRHVHVEAFVAARRLLPQARLVELDADGQAAAAAVATAVTAAAAVLIAAAAGREREAHRRGDGTRTQYSAEPHVVPSDLSTRDTSAPRAPTIF